MGKIYPRRARRGAILSSSVVERSAVNRNPAHYLILSHVFLTLPREGKALQPRAYVVSDTPEISAAVLYESIERRVPRARSVTPVRQAENLAKRRIVPEA